MCQYNYKYRAHYQKLQNIVPESSHSVLYVTCFIHLGTDYLMQVHLFASNMI